ncbi:MAG: WGR domain-containing protein [Pleurocapsa sp. CRU_1_2]|nr:WGR domain-containing protein [Pleurocapsa sp. CRU_1_2]
MNQIVKLTQLQYRNASKNSYKFYNLSLTRDNRVAIRYGRIGSNGKSLVHQFSSQTAANEKYTKLLREKIGKGYIEIEERVESKPIKPEAKPDRQPLLEDFPNLI